MKYGTAYCSLFYIVQKVHKIPEEAKPDLIIMVSAKEDFENRSRVCKKAIQKKVINVAQKAC